MRLQWESLQLLLPTYFFINSWQMGGSDIGVYVYMYVLHTCLITCVQYSGSSAKCLKQLNTANEAGLRPCFRGVANASSSLAAIQLSTHQNPSCHLVSSHRRCLPILEDHHHNNQIAISLNENESRLTNTPPERRKEKRVQPR
jgi:hypothetical protein